MDNRHLQFFQHFSYIIEYLLADIYIKSYNMTNVTSISYIPHYHDKVKKGIM